MPTPCNFICIFSLATLFLQLVVISSKCKWTDYSIFLICECTVLPVSVILAFGFIYAMRTQTVIMDSLWKHDNMELTTVQDSKFKTNLFQAFESTPFCSTKPELPVIVPSSIVLNDRSQCWRYRLSFCSTLFLGREKLSAFTRILA